MLIGDVVVNSANAVCDVQSSSNPVTGTSLDLLSSSPLEIQVDDQSGADGQLSVPDLDDGRYPEASRVDGEPAILPTSDSASSKLHIVAPVAKSLLRKRIASSHDDSDSVSQSSVGTSVSRAVSVRELQEKAEHVRMKRKT